MWVLRSKRTSCLRIIPAAHYPAARQGSGKAGVTGVCCGCCECGKGVETVLWLLIPSTLISCSPQIMSSSRPFLDLDPPRSRQIHYMPHRLLSSLKRPFSKSKHESDSSILVTREPGPS